MKPQRAKQRRRTQTWEQWRLELIERLEALHMLVVEVDASQSAFEAIYGDTSWPTDKDPERRRALNRMSCHVDQARAALDDLLHDSHEVIVLAIKRAKAR